MKSFEEFWNQYPSRNGRKCGKSNAEKAFKKLNPDEGLFAEIMQKLDLQKRHYAACKRAKVFVPEFPDAERWIRGFWWGLGVGIAATTVAGLAILCRMALVLASNEIKRQKRNDGE